MKEGKTLEDTRRREKIMKKRDLLRLSRFKEYIKKKLRKLRRKRKY